MNDLPTTSLGLEVSVWKGRPSVLVHIPLVLALAIFISGLIALLLIHPQWDNQWYFDNASQFLAFDRLSQFIVWAVIILISASSLAVFSTFIKTYTTRYELFPQTLQVDRGILIRTSDELQLYRIRDIQLQRTIFDRLIGTGTVYIISVDMTCPELYLRNIKNSRGVLNQLSQSAEHIRGHMGVAGLT